MSETGAAPAGDREAFPRWARGRQLALLRTAILVTGDHQRAEGPRPGGADPGGGVEFWLDDHTVVHESRAEPRRVVARRIGSHRLGLVSTVEGYDPDREPVVASYARIWDRWPETVCTRVVRVLNIGLAL